MDKNTSLDLHLPAKRDSTETDRLYGFRDFSLFQLVDVNPEMYFCPTSGHPFVHLKYYPMHILGTCNWDRVITRLLNSHTLNLPLIMFDSKKDFTNKICGEYNT